jgi:hypothetical protein
MAVIISNGATSLSTASGFYRVEAHNLGMFSTTDLALSSTRTIAVTFANAGACQGLILALVCSATTASLKSVVVTLQENVASVWTDRATVTYSAATIANSVTNAHSDGWFVPFTGGTFPYTVTTAASTWRFQVSQSGAQSNNWSVRTSDATNPFYASWCANSVSFASNDVVICKDVVTIDQTATFKGVLGTGDTTRSVACIICRSTTPAPSTVANLVWANPPAVAYTLTLDGLMVLGNHSGFRIGTAASPIPVAQMATVDVIAATSGTAINSGISHPEHSVGGANCRGMSLFFYGANPTPMVAVLNASAATGQPNIVTTTSTGWANGDRLFVGGFTTRGIGEATIFTINSIAGANIGLNANLGTTARSANGRVIKLNGYGVVIKAPTTGVPFFIGYVSNLAMLGSLVQHCSIRFEGDPGSLVSEDSANRTAVAITYCAFEMSASSTLASQVSLQNMRVPETGCAISNNVFCSTVPFILSALDADSSLTTIASNTCIRLGATASAAPQLAVAWQGTFTNNILEGSNSALLLANGVGATVSGNRFWGTSSANGGMQIARLLDCSMSANFYENNAAALTVQTQWIGGASINDVFGAEVANAVDLGFTSGCYVNTLLQSPTGALTFGTGGFLFTGSLVGSHLRIADFNDGANDDRGYLKRGNYQRTGAGLSDTTCRTAGGYAIRLAPNSGTSVLSWPNLVSERVVPTGNIQAKTMTVTVWAYINNAAFYAGTHIKPTLFVKYDNTTTVSSVATATAGSWQQLAVTFTPSTTYGQIEVWTACASDASGANVYAYVDDMQIAYPAGVSVNLGGLDLWAGATPVWPPIATVPSLGGVWDEAESAHTVVGSMAARLTASASAAAVAAVQSAINALPSSSTNASAVWSAVARTLTADPGAAAHVTTQNAIAALPAASAVAGSVRTELALELLRIIEIAKLHGLDIAAPLVVDPTTRTAGTIEQSIDTVGDVVTVTRTA